MKSFCLRWLVPLLTIWLLASCGGGPVELHGAVFQQPRPFEFQLTNVNTGQPFTTDDLHGKVALVFFGYTFCPDICPTTLAEFTRVKELLGASADDVRFMMITVDPERDTPERLARYVTGFDEAFVGLHGDPTTTKRLTDTYGIVAERREDTGSSAGYLIDHTAMSFAIDKEGYLRAGYPLGADVKLVADDLRALMGE